MRSLPTERLLLRPFALTDAPIVEALAGDAEVARTSSVPHPYPPGGARDWIAAGHEAAAQGRSQPAERPPAMSLMPGPIFI
jgi:Acetyltransferase (GNAT) domain